MEWGKVLVFGLVKVNSIVSPSAARTTGPGNCPLKVQALYRVPLLSMGISTSIAVKSTLTVLACAGAIVQAMNTNKTNMVALIDTRRHMCIVRLLLWPKDCCRGTLVQRREQEHDLSHV